MKFPIQFLTIIFLTLIVVNAKGQFPVPETLGVRTPINLFPDDQQQILLDAMMDYITPEVIRMHCSTSQLTDGEMSPPGLHSDFDFLPFHRLYIEGMEDYLMSQGLSQFVPLPKWDPTYCTPPIFQAVDPDCADTDCDMGGGASCNGQHNWCPNINIPSYLKLPEMAGSNNDLCDWPFSPSTPNQGGDDGGLSQIIMGNQSSPNAAGSVYHDKVHFIMGNFNEAVMGNMASPAAPIFWLWHAFVDDIWKEYERICMQSTTLPVDYYMKLHANAMISARDRGEEPAIFNNPLWASEDIWCRNQDDGVLNQVNENPISDGTNPVYVYVRIRNRGFQRSPAASNNNMVHLYWAKASTALGWPQSWDGSTTEINNGVPVIMGNVANAPKHIPAIDAAGHAIVKFLWFPPDPSDYETIIDDPWHFCLLARIVSNIDPMANEGTSSLYENIKFNNNIVMKNLTVIDMQELVGNPDNTYNDDKLVGANVSVGNVDGQVRSFDFEFSLPKYCGDKKITEEAEIKITMEEAIWDKWVAGGSQAENIIVSREDRFQVIVTGDSARLKNLTFPANERGLIHLSFNYLVEKMPFAPEYEYHVVQRVSSSNDIVGGEVFKIKSPVRNGFMANAGADDEILKGDAGRLDAVDIYEPAIYNWYDPAGNLIYTGKDLQASPIVTTTYKLEVIATTDGIKDYDEANVNVLIYAILGISPNPSSTQINVNYLANEATSAYITIMKPYSGISDQYILDVNQSMTTINVSNYPAGTYNVILVCDGQSFDVETLIIQ